MLEGGTSICQMKCTVVLPVYNAGAPLREAIESILAQSETDFELLIIDGCSQDGSAGTIREFAAAGISFAPGGIRSASALRDGTLGVHGKRGLTALRPRLGTGFPATLRMELERNERPYKAGARLC